MLLFQFDFEEKAPPLHEFTISWQSFYLNVWREGGAKIDMSHINTISVMRKDIYFYIFKK